MSTSVVYATLESISRSLHTSAMDLDGTGSASPSSVDAGEMTSVISAMVSKIAESAGGLCEGMELASSEVVNSKSSYWSADDGATQSFGNPTVR